MKEETRILFVEDAPTDADLIARQIRRHGLTFQSLRVETREDFLAALETFRPDLVISDYSLPVFDGLTALLLARERAPHVPVIIATSPRNEETAVECMKAGAADYILKDRLSRVGPAVQAVLAHEEERRSSLSVETALRKMRTQLEIARQIQQGLLPSPVPSIQGYDIGGVSHPAEAAGGDYYDIIRLLDGTVAIITADVSGHGLGPALLAAATHAYLRALALGQTDIPQMMTSMNSLLHEDVRGRSFVAMMFARLDPATRALEYASAGQESGYVLDGQGRVRLEMESTDLPLGAEPSSTFPLGPSIILDPGDLLCLLTDGVREAMSPAEEFFGIERALDVVRANRARPAQEIVEELHRAVAAFSVRVVNDDITAVIVKTAGE